MTCLPGVDGSQPRAYDWNMEIDLNTALIIANQQIDRCIDDYKSGNMNRLVLANAINAVNADLAARYGIPG